MVFWRLFEHDATILSHVSVRGKINVIAMKQTCLNDIEALPGVYLFPCSPGITCN